jgi:ATP-dependent exoDNAse (exonuclease V) beta subunit
MAGPFQPQDQSAREKILDRLDETLFVEAGAGTGKTSSLVGRMLRLVITGRASIGGIAAITFTEAAAAELGHRIREGLEKAGADESLSPPEQESARRALQGLDLASIQTLHGFAAAILQERPLEAGLPPEFEIMDEIAGELAFEERWRDWLDGAMRRDETILDLRLAFTMGLSPDQLRNIALEFHQNYDLLESYHIAEALMPEAAAADRLLSESDELARLCQYSDLRDDDPLYAGVQRLLRIAVGLGKAPSDEPDSYLQLTRLLWPPGNRGRTADWRKDSKTGANACTQLKALVKEVRTAVDDEIAAVRQSALSHLLQELRGFALDYAAGRKRQGRANYHDLLVWARDLLRDNLAVRDYFRQRFTHLLIDEVQDTDPIQAEIALFLSEDAPLGGAAGDRPRQWQNITPERGKLFVVGDPKQSIYRFRRADIRQVAGLREQMGGEIVQLVQNFRSQQPVAEWVNHIFGPWMAEGETQPGYEPIVHRWEGEPWKQGRGSGEGKPRPAVWRLGDVVVSASAAEVRRQEDEAISRLLRNIVEDGWQVLDREKTEAEGQECYRPAEFRDICLLLRARTGLSSLENALEAADAPYRMEGASLVFHTQEVRDLMNCLRAIDDPSDEVAIVAALRSPAFACSDVELLEFHQAGSRFDYLTLHGPVGGPVSQGLEKLRGYHAARNWDSVAHLIDRFIRERHLMQLALDHPRTREHWRRYRFMVDQARGFVAAGGESLRGYIEWMDRRRDENARVAEAASPDADEDAVRIMTVHAAKGLEFPIVILTRINSDLSRTGGSRPVIFERTNGSIEARAGSEGSRFETPGYADALSLERALEQEEAVRLLYVAATRARDHLAVSMYRRDRGISLAHRVADFAEGGDYLWQRAQPHELPPKVADESGADGIDPESHSLEEREQWTKARAALIKANSAPTSIAATRLASVDKEESESDEPWKRGRGSSEVGRAVHSVLQTIDLATGSGIDDTANAQATAEGIPHRRAEVAQLVRKAIASDIVQRAVNSTRYWREVPLGIPLEGGAVLEGFIDLLFEENGHLVVVDYKTDDVDADQTAARLQNYRMQAGAYALAVNRATGRPVSEVVYLFVRLGREESVPNIAALATEAENAARDYIASPPNG